MIALKNALHRSASNFLTHSKNLNIESVEKYSAVLFRFLVAGILISEFSKPSSEVRFLFPEFAHSKWGAIIFISFCGILCVSRIAFIGSGTLLIFLLKNTLLANAADLSLRFHPIIYFLLVLLVFDCLRFLPWLRKKEVDFSQNNCVLLFLIQTYIAVIYFEAGIGKLLGSPIDWFNGQTLQFYFGIRYAVSNRLGGFPLANYPFFTATGSILTLCFELCFLPVIIFARGKAWIFLIFALAFHLAAEQLMTIDFFYPWIACGQACFIPLFFAAEENQGLAKFRLRICSSIIFIILLSSILMLRLTRL